MIRNNEKHTKRNGTSLRDFHILHRNKTRTPRQLCTEKATDSCDRPICNVRSEASSRSSNPEHMREYQTGLGNMSKEKQYVTFSIRR